MGLVRRDDVQTEGTGMEGEWLETETEVLFEDLYGNVHDQLDPGVRWVDRSSPDPGRPTVPSGFRPQAA